VTKTTADTCVVIPCYNEEERLNADLIVDFCNDREWLDILFVDDGSTDNTAEILGEICQDSSGVDFIRMKKNSGKSEAVRSGINYSISKAYSFIGYFDADLSTPLHELDHLRHILKNNNHTDIVIGSRVKMLGYDIERSIIRHLAGRIFATAASLTLNLPVYDTQCGAKIFSNNKRLEIIFRNPFLSKWAFDVEILRRHIMLCELQPIESAGKIEEVPLRNWRDVAGSKVKALDFFSALMNLLYISYHYKRQNTKHHYKCLLEKDDNKY
jgi:glycosyltransferase involved in cell wall biosynthesis